MAINYVVTKAGLPGKDVYSGRVSLKGSYNKEMLLERMLEMGSALGKEEMEGVFSLFEKAVYTICKEGNKVTLDNFMQFTPAMGGAFDGGSAGFDKTRNNVYITAQISRAYNKSFNNEASVEKIRTSEKKPLLLEVKDSSSGAVNSAVTPKDIITIHGERMKFNAGGDGEYLRFVNEENHSEFITITRFQKAADKEIVFLMPEVPYKKGFFEIVSRMGTKTLRSGKSSTVQSVKQ